MRTMQDVVTYLECAGYIWQVLEIEHIALCMDAVMAGELTFHNRMTDSITEIYNFLIKHDALTMDDQLIFNDWIVEQQRIGEETRVSHDYNRTI